MLKTKKKQLHQMKDEIKFLHISVITYSSWKCTRSGSILVKEMFKFDVFPW